MSAIFGMVHTGGGLLEPVWLEGMRQSLLHRGPDGSGIYHRGSVGLGHLLLRVTPEAQYEQSPCRIEGLVISAQARLDEREVLMDKLRIPAERRLRITDPEMIGLGYRQWGERCVEHFLGDFAFAIWDEQEQKLFCAKDHLGIRPFFYAYQQGLFVFATELRALVRCKLFATQVDYGHVRDLIIDLRDQPENSGWTNIKLLRGGHTLVLQNQSLRTHRYWKPMPQAQIWCKDPRDYGQRLRHLLEQAIADRMRTDYEVGLTLSGGLDSSSIACIAAPQLRQRGRLLHTASSVLSPEWPYDDADEMPYIQSVLDQEPNILPSFVYSGDHAFLEGIEQKFERHQMLVDQWHYVDTALYDQLQQRKVRRELSGYLGDSTVSLYDIYPLAHLLRKGQFSRFWKMLQARQALAKSSYYSILKAQLVLPLLPFAWMKYWYRIKGRPYPWSIDDLPFEMSAQERRILLQRLENYYRPQGFYDHKNLSDNIWDKNADFDAPEMDCSAAHAGLETSFPFADKRVIDFLFQLPVEAFFEQGLSRGLIRMATKETLPALVNQRRDKGNYSPGFFYILKKDLSKVLNWMEVDTKSLKDIHFINIDKTKNSLLCLENPSHLANFNLAYWAILKIFMSIAFARWNASNQQIITSKTENDHEH